MLKVASTWKIIIPTEQLKGMTQLCERHNGMDKDTLEIQQVIYVHRFAGHVSTYFLHTFTYKYG